LCAGESEGYLVSQIGSPHVLGVFHYSCTYHKSI